MRKKVNMEVEKLVYVTFGFLFFSACFLKGFSLEEDKINGNKSADVRSSVDEESTDEIAPGEVAPGATEKPTKVGQVVSPLDGEKTLRIKQSEDGKTAEEVKNETKSDGENESGEKNIQGGKGPKIKEDGKVDEKKPEEIGLELRILNDDNFEHLTQASTGATTGDWLVLFTKKENCEQCGEAEKEMKIVYERVKHKLNVAKVEESSSSKLTFKRFEMEDLPKIFLFHHGKKYIFEGNKSADTLLKFVDGGFHVMPWALVRKPYTFFELFVEESVEELKHMVRFKKNVSVLIFLAGFVVGISLTSICGSVLFHLLENFKDDEENESVQEMIVQQEEIIKNKAE